jgi:hypothetical protein
MRPTANDTLVVSRRLKGDATKHNEHGEKLCGWKAAK